MANLPHGWQYPQPPMYPQGPVGPGFMAQPMQPASMRGAVALMYTGAALAVVGGIVATLTTNNVTYDTYATTSSGTTATVHSASSLPVGIITGVIIAGVWLWMAWKAGAGRNWARVLSTVFFCFQCLNLISGIASLAGPGHSVLPFITVLVEWGVGLAAIILLWNRDSSYFVALVKQARLARAYAAAYLGHQPPGYGQPPYGQPGYGQPGGYGQPPVP